MKRIVSISGKNISVAEHTLLDFLKYNSTDLAYSGSVLDLMSAGGNLDFEKVIIDFADQDPDLLAACIAKIAMFRPISRIFVTTRFPVNAKMVISKANEALNSSFFKMVDRTLVLCSTMEELAHLEESVINTPKSFNSVVVSFCYEIINPELNKRMELNQDFEGSVHSCKESGYSGILLRASKDFEYDVKILRHIKELTSLPVLYNYCLATIDDNRFDDYILRTEDTYDRLIDISEIKHLGIFAGSVPICEMKSDEDIEYIKQSERIQDLVYDVSCCGDEFVLNRCRTCPKFLECKARNRSLRNVGAFIC